MSIINQVLADLDQRRSGQPLPANGVLIDTVLAASSGASRYTQYLPIGITIVIVTIAVVLLWPASDYTVALTNTYKAISTPSVTATEPQDSRLKLASQLSQVDEERTAGLTSVVNEDQLPERPVAQIETSAGMPVAKQTASFPRSDLRDVWIKKVNSFSLGREQPVNLLLSGNVGMAVDKAVSLQAASQLGYAPALALDSNITVSVNRKNSYVVADAASLRSQPVVAKRYVLDSKQPVELPNANQKDMRSDYQPQQNRSIRNVTNAQRAEQIYQNALVLNTEGDLHQALAQLKEVLQLNVSHLKARYTLAALLINTDKPDAALSELIVGMNIQPDYAPFAKLYGRLMVLKGDYADAIAVMERARGNAQRDPEYYAQLAAIYQQQGLHPEAIAYFKQALRWQSTVGTWWMGLGISLEQQQQKRDAVTAYQKAEKTGTLTEGVLAYVQSRVQSLELWK